MYFLSSYLLQVTVSISNNFSAEAEFQGTIAKFTKGNKISSLIVNVLHETKIRHFHAVVVQKQEGNH